MFRADATARRRANLFARCPSRWARAGPSVVHWYFQQLAAETGVDETMVRRVLDRFRAEDRSFLTPPTTEVARSATPRERWAMRRCYRVEKVSGQGADPGCRWVEQQVGRTLSRIAGDCRW